MGNSVRSTKLKLSGAIRPAVMPLTAQEFDIIVNEMGNKLME